jgi:hypothetical protein
VTNTKWCHELLNRDLYIGQGNLSVQSTRMLITRIHTYVDSLPEGSSLANERMQWCNRDLIPIPEDRRTWTWQGFAGYWIITGVSSSSDWKYPSPKAVNILKRGKQLGMDCGLHALSPGPQCRSINGSHRRSFLGNIHDRRGSWLDGLS